MVVLINIETNTIFMWQQQLAIAKYKLLPCILLIGMSLAIRLEVVNTLKRT